MPKNPLPLLVLAIALLVVPATASAATVANTNDSGPGSLRQTVIGAAPGETIAVPAGTYAITTGEILLNKNVTIAGAGQAATIIRAGATGFRLFHVAKGIEATISGLTLRDAVLAEPSGIAEGAAIFTEEGGVTASDVAFVNNVVDASATATGAEGGIAGGGAVAGEEGRVTVSASVFSGNRAISRGGPGENGGIAEGGAVYMEDGVVAISGSTFTDNLADASAGQSVPNVNQDGGIAGGGAVSGEGSGSLTISTSSFTGNRAIALGGPGGGGGIAEGGGAYAEDVVAAISTSSFANNHTDATPGQGPANAEQDGGIASGGSVSYDDPAAGSSFTTSTVTTSSVRSPTGPGGSAGIADGGGVNVETFNGNAALSELTITGNEATIGTAVGAEGIAEGGGLNLEVGSKSTASIVSLTLFGNAVSGPTSVNMLVEGGNLTAYDEATIANTIVSGGIGPNGTGNCGTQANDHPTSKGFNLESANQCKFAAPGDQVNTDPQLGPLGPNGGPTPTMLPSFTSPAVDRGLAFGLNADQRGVQRPIDFPSIPNAPGSDGSDVGAVELQPSNAFGFGKLKKNKKKGTARLVVNLPTPNVGVVTLSGKGLKPRTKAVAGTTSKVTFVVALKSKKLKKALRKKGKRKVAIKVTYTPSGNAALTKVRKAKLVKKSKHGKSRRQAGK
jgi:hypothetical protein